MTNIVTSIGSSDKLMSCVDGEIHLRYQIYQITVKFSTLSSQLVSIANFDRFQIVGPASGIFIIRFDIRILLIELFIKTTKQKHIDLFKLIFILPMLHPFSDSSHFLLILFVISHFIHLFIYLISFY